MKITGLYEVCFSPTGHTRKVLEVFTKAWDMPKTRIDLTDLNVEFDKYDIYSEDLCVFAVPSYCGRVPIPATQRINQMRGNNTPAIIIATYGNKSYDDTLNELQDIVEARGFYVVAALAVPTEHNIAPEVATGRIDDKDIAKLHAMSISVRTHISKKNGFHKAKLYGNETYKELKILDLKPTVNPHNCGNCGVCANNCPVGAIPLDNPKETDVSRCISCMRCVTNCPTEARVMPKSKLNHIVSKLKKECKERKEIQLFVNNNTGHAYSQAIQTPAVQVMEQPVMEEPMMPVMEEPMMPVMEEPMMPVMEEPVMPVMEEPVMPVMQEPMMPVMEEPVMPVMQEPVMPVMEEPVMPVMQEPVMPVMEEPVIPVMQEPVMPVMQEPVMPVMQEPVMPVMEEPMAPITEDIMEEFEMPEFIEPEQIVPKSTISSQQQMEDPASVVMVDTTSEVMTDAVEKVEIPSVQHEFVTPGLVDPELQKLMSSSVQEPKPLTAVEDMMAASASLMSTNIGGGTLPSAAELSGGTDKDESDTEEVDIDFNMPEMDDLEMFSDEEISSIDGQEVPQEEAVLVQAEPLPSFGFDDDFDDFIDDKSEIEEHSIEESKDHIPEIQPVGTFSDSSVSQIQDMGTLKMDDLLAMPEETQIDVSVLNVSEEAANLVKDEDNNGIDDDLLSKKETELMLEFEEIRKNPWRDKEEKELDINEVESEADSLFNF